MRASLLLPTLLLLPACAATGSEGPSTPSQAAGGPCRNEGLDAFTGRKVTSELGAESLARSGAKTLRWGPPGAAMTMDFREDRLTVSYDADMAVTSARCG